jgi:DNA-binding transcriptional ArsR family regulator
MNLKDLNEAAEEASNFLKSLGNAHRLRLLCLMMEKERPVGDLAEAVGLAQSAVSQHLARMRQEGLISSRRDGQTIYYQLSDKRATKLLKLLESLFCEPK